MEKHGARALAPYAALTIASVGFRAPALLNAAAANSDAAIVGLQAMHMLRGEWSAFLFGSGYQSSADAVVAAVFFVVLGPTPVALMLSALSGHVALTLLAYGVLQRHLSRAKALFVCGALVVTAAPVNIYALYPPREASLALAFASLAVIDRACSSARPMRTVGAGAGLATFACFADPYAIVFLPALLVFAMETIRAAARDERWSRRAPPVLLGALVGGLPLIGFWLRRGSIPPEVTPTLALVARNAGWLFARALPCALAARPFPGPWGASAAVAAMQLTAAAVVVVVAFGYAAFDGSSARAAGIGRLARFALLTSLVTVAAFLSSRVVVDVYSARYLVSIVLVLPFALGPFAARVSGRALGAAVAPYFASAALAGWLGFGSFVEGFRPRLSPAGAASDERALGAALHARGIRFAQATYWEAYRLTFLYEESILVVPEEERMDRRPQYRAGLPDATAVAHIFEDRRKAAQFEAREALRGDARLERFYVGRFTVSVVNRQDGYGPRADLVTRATREMVSRP